MNRSVSFIVHSVLLIILSTVLFTCYAAIVSAAEVETTNSGGSNNSNSGGSNSTNSGGSNNSNSGGSNVDDCIGFCNPLKAKSISELFLKIIDVILVFAVPIIIIYIMYGGFQMVTAGGEAGKIEHGRNTVMWAIVGGVIILGAKLIVEIIEATIKSF